jgi:hypothetical protein
VAQIKFSPEQINTPDIGLDYAMDKDPKQFINTLITYKENAIRYTKIQNALRCLAPKKIKQILETNTKRIT